eukprot:8251947-Lingulodinium_polyedra.AAC.1
MSELCNASPPLGAFHPASCKDNEPDNVQRGFPAGSYAKCTGKVPELDDWEMSAMREQRSRLLDLRLLFKRGE